MTTNKTTRPRFFKILFSLEMFIGLMAGTTIAGILLLTLGLV